MAARVGRWDAADPRFGFVKQHALETWTDEVRSDEIATLQDLYSPDAAAIGHVAEALEIAG